MKYLLDINVLIALTLVRHEFHERVSLWIKQERSSEFATCSITELGFVRVASQVPAYGLTVAQARTFLVRLKSNRVIRFSFLADDCEIGELPAWVRTSKQITDGHLVQLAKANGAVLATLDARLPEAYLIPERRASRR